jgi:hypothetical protein
LLCSGRRENVLLSLSFTTILHSAPLYVQHYKLIPPLHTHRHTQIRRQKEKRERGEGEWEKQEKNKNTNRRVTELVNVREFNLSVALFVYNSQHMK